MITTKSKLRIACLCNTLMFAFVCSSIIHAQVDDNIKTKVQLLIVAINKDPDPLHSEYTPAVHELSKIGIRALPMLIKEMNNPHYDTRLRIDKAITSIIAREHGFIPGKGWTNKEKAKQVADFWIYVGKLDADQELAERKIVTKNFKRKIETLLNKSLED